jgi:hypothetical protein
MHLAELCPSYCPDSRYLEEPPLVEVQYFEEANMQYPNETVCLLITEFTQWLQRSKKYHLYVAPNNVCSLLGVVTTVPLLFVPKACYCTMLHGCGGGCKDHNEFHIMQNFER